MTDLQGSFTEEEDQEEDGLQLPPYDLDKALYGYSRMNYIRKLQQGSYIATSGRMPSLDDQEGNITYEN